MLHSIISNRTAQKEVQKIQYSATRITKPALYSIYSSFLIGGLLIAQTAYAKPKDKQVSLFSSLPFFSNSNNPDRRPPTLEEVQIREYIPRNRSTESVPVSTNNNTKKNSSLNTTVDALTSSSFGYGKAPIVPFDQVLTQQQLDTNLKMARSTALEEILDNKVAQFSVLNTSQSGGNPVPETQLPVNIQEAMNNEAITSASNDINSTAHQVEQTGKQTDEIDIIDPVAIDLTERQLHQPISDNVDPDPPYDNKRSISIASDAHLTSTPSKEEIDSELTQQDTDDGENISEKTTVELADTITQPPPQVDAQTALLQGARQSSIKPATIKANTSSEANVPAFRKLMSRGVEQLKNNQLNQAEASFTHAQRMIPQSSAVYFYLGQVALKKNQPRKAQAFARRGLIVSDSNDRKRSLWQVILKSAQISGDNNTINEAKQALQ